MAHATHTPTNYGFDTPLDRTHLNTMKWEAEIQRKNDPSLLCFGVAEMDFPAAPPIRAAIQHAVADGHFGYPSKRTSYFEAITSFYQRRFHWSIDATWLQSNIGTYCSMQTFIEELTTPGDEIIYQPPVHHVFAELIELSGRVPVANPLRRSGTTYVMDRADLVTKISPRTKMLLLCSPHNPVGRVWTREELEQLRAICEANGIVVIADEVYCGLIYPGVTFTPYAALSRDASMGSVTLMSASKSFNVPGLKHALTITENPRFRAAFRAGLQRHNLSFGSSIFGEVATEAALAQCDDWSDAVVDYIQGNLTFLRRFLHEQLPEVTLIEPEMAFFAWLDFRGLGMNDQALRIFLEDEAHVTVSHGDTMGSGGTGHVRLNITTARTTLEEGLKRIAAAWQKRQ